MTYVSGSGSINAELLSVGVCAFSGVKVDVGELPDGVDADDGLAVETGAHDETMIVTT